MRTIGGETQGVTSLQRQPLPIDQHLHGAAQDDDVFGDAGLVRFRQALVARQQGQLEQFEAEMWLERKQGRYQHAVRPRLLAQSVGVAADEAAIDR